MSSEESSKKAPESGELPVHTKQETCPLCKANKELFGPTMVVCYQERGNTPKAGENTRTFS